MGQQLRWCADEECAARPHIENCRQCFGFGLRPGNIPITADESMAWDNGQHKHIICSTCGGSPLVVIRVLMTDLYGENINSQRAV